MGFREQRLRAEHERMQTLSAESSFISFVPKGDPPDEYVVTFTCRGMIDSERTGEGHVAQIYLPAAFPRVPPKVSFKTPCFHPNIAALIQMGPVQAKIQELLAQAPDEESRQQIQQKIMEDEDMFTARVCLDTLDLNWSPAIGLDLICLELAEMIQYKRFNPGDPLNQEAAMWAAINRERLPVDNRSVLDERALAGIRIVSETDIDIRIVE